MNLRKSISILIFLFFTSIVLKSQSSILDHHIEISKCTIGGYELIKQLESKTGYSINYSESVLKIPETISLLQTKGSVQYFLDKIFGLQEVEYVVKEQKILVKRNIKNEGIRSTKKSLDFISISGIVTEKQTNTPIGFANIGIKNLPIGTVTNAEGEFVFHIPTAYSTDSMQVSSLAYENYQFKISDAIGKKVKIELHSKNYNLSEVTIKPIDPLDVIKNANAKIQENYPTKSVRLYAFIREILNENGNYVQLTEAACLINYAPYSIEIDKPTCESNYYDTHLSNTPCNFQGKGISNYYDNYVSKEDQAKILELRTSKNHSKLISPYHIVGGPLNLLSADKVKFRNDFMDTHYFKAYRYKLESISFYNGKEVYVISFEPKNKRTDPNPGVRDRVYKRSFRRAPFKGKMYIEIGSLAYIGFEYSLADIYSYKKAYQHFQYDIRLDYKEINGKWYIHQVRKVDKHVEYTAVNNGKEMIDTITSCSQILVNNIETDDYPAFEENETFTNQDNLALSAYPSEYHEEFWSSYNTILPTLPEQKIINDLSEKENLNKQFKASQTRDTLMIPPIAKRIPGCDSLPFEVVQDNYLWMRNFSSKDMVEYLVSENSYAENYMLSTRNLQMKLAKEMIRNTHQAAKIRYRKVGDYYYYERDSGNIKYPQLCRKKGAISGPEEIIIDLNKQAEKHSCFSADEYSIKPDNSTALYLIDTVGNEIYTGYFYDIKQNSKLIDSLQNLFEFEWLGNDGLIYTKDDYQGRSKSVYYHVIGSPQKLDRLIFQGQDGEILRLGTDAQKKFILITRFKENENEILYAESSSILTNKMKILSPMRKEHFYEAEIKDKQVFILSNKNIPNKQVFVTSLKNPDEKDWKILFANPNNEQINSFYLIGNTLIVCTMKNANTRIVVFDYMKGKTKIIEFNEPCDLRITSIDDENQSFEFKYSSLRVPHQYYSFDLKKFKYTENQDTGEEMTLDPDNYKLERIWVNSSDQVKIPVTLLYRKNEKNWDKKILQWLASKPFQAKGNHHLLLTAYGANGTSFSTGFNPAILPLVDRGFIYAIAHVRGGSELGEEWHLGAHKMNKKNSCQDFINCAKYLTEQGYTSKDKLIIEGGSAGGILIGYAINSNPELFKAAILEVPTLNVIESAMDTSYRLNANFIHELGNPYHLSEYNYMKSYSPHQNLKAGAYPSILLLSGYVDQRVRFWQSAMYIAKLRQMNSGKNTVLYQTDFYSGHVGPSGKNASIEKAAYKYAFILDVLGIKD